MTAFDCDGRQVGDPLVVRPGAVLITDAPDGPSIWWPSREKSMLQSGAATNTTPVLELFGPGVVEIRVEEI